MNSWVIDLVQTAGIIAAFFVTRKALIADADVRRVGNSIRLTEHHRYLWERLLADSQLARILDPDADIRRRPVTAAEKMFVIFLLLHMSDTYFAMKTGFYQRPEGLAKDIQQLFSLPIPRTVWEEVKHLQEREFVDFVEECFQEDVDAEAA